jgi:predicted DNA-binding ribbon-helix-helix protein
VKLLDYRDRMAELDASKNPFAMVVKAHLKLQETKKDNRSRKVWKMRLIRQLYEEGYNQEEVLNLFNFVDWVLVLPKRLEAEFWLELKAYEEERKMPYITSVERIGYDRGKAEGREEEAQRSLERERSLILRQLIPNQKINATDQIPPSPP